MSETNHRESNGQRITVSPPQKLQNDRAGITAFNESTALRPAQQLILVVRPYSMRCAFADSDLMVPLVLIGVAIALCLPVLAAMRSSHFSLGVGAPLIIAICLLCLAPWMCFQIAGRRGMKELDSKTDEPNRKGNAHDILRVLLG